MKKLILLSTLCAVIAVNASAQYCTFTVDYANSFLAGITNVQLNSSPAINRSSTTTENSGFTNTGITGTVYKGQSYNFSVTANQDNLICGSYNIKVYIDYNGDLDFVDAGEEVVVKNNVVAGVQNSTFLVPLTATTAQVGMRIALKMATGCGHNAVSPCNIPVDPIGWHGEVEDYTLDIQPSTGINEQDVSNGVSIFPNPSNGKFNFKVDNNTGNITKLEIFNIFGQEIFATNNIKQQQSSEIDLSNFPKGMYVVKFYDGEQIYTEKLVTQ